MSPSSTLPSERCRIVITGGPGGGKTTAGDIFRRELGDRVVLVPETATLLFSGNFPRSTVPGALRATQHAIFHVQRSLEDVQAATHPERILLCDRGTVDGAAYWPDGPDAFFSSLGTTFAAEITRYDGVVFFESAATAGYEVDRSNPVRVETTSQAALLDRKLFELWSCHPRFSHVPNSESFFKKISTGLDALQRMVHAINGNARVTSSS
jgi:predicted ATPase